MEQNALISIIIPVYNMEMHLRQCLDSVIGQTYKNLEIICVNDGSTDSSRDIINEYVAKDSRVVLIDQKNQGPLAARNNGNDHMHGKYFFFLDSDDYLKDNAIETLYNLMIKDGTDIALTNFMFQGHPNYRYDRELLSIDEVLTDIFNCKARMFPCWGMLIGKCQIDNEYRNYHLCEDELYALDFFVDTNRVSFSSEILITYRNKERKAIKPKDFSFYYQGFMAARDFYNMIGVDRPHLQHYAKARLLMHTFYCYVKCQKKTVDPAKYQEVKDTIKAHRKDVLKNSKAATTIRLLCLLSYLGLGTVSALYKVYNRIAG